MDFVTIDDLLDDVLSEAIGCPIYTARDRIRWAAIQFCKQTGVSVETTSEIDLDAGEDIIQLPCPSTNVRAWQVLWLKTTENTVWPLNRRDLAERGLKWDGLEGQWPQGYVKTSNKEIRLIPKPDQDKTAVMTIHCSYIPQVEATRIDAVLVDEYREAIVHGALSRLLKMSAEEWYDPVEARERDMFFTIAQSEARALADKDFQTGEQTVKMRPMA